MGLDAFVSCRCWQDGVTTTPPVPREFIVYKEESGLDLTIPYDGNEDLYQEFDSWVDSGACGHEDMAQASVYVSNWTGYRRFQGALEAAGWQHFPALRAYLPQINGGSLPAQEAPQALAGLQRFTGQTRLASSGADGDPAVCLRRLRAAAKPRTARDFAAIMQALQEVLRAAVETGNPVIWC